MIVTVTKNECITIQTELEIENNDCYTNDTDYYRFVIEDNKVYVHKIDLYPFLGKFQFAIYDSTSENFEKIVNTYKKISLTDYEKYFIINVLCHKPLTTGTSNSPD